jgi:hypothetical protein
MKLNLGNDARVREILLKIHGTLNTKVTSETIYVQPENIDETARPTVQTREVYHSHDFLYYVTNIFSLSGPVAQILLPGDHEFPFCVKLSELNKCSDKERLSQTPLPPSFAFSPDRFFRDRSNLEIKYCIKASVYKDGRLTPKSSAKYVLILSGSPSLSIKSERLEIPSTTHEYADCFDFGDLDNVKLFLSSNADAVIHVKCVKVKFYQRVNFDQTDQMGRKVKVLHKKEHRPIILSHEKPRDLSEYLRGMELAEFVASFQCCHASMSYEMSVDFKLRTNESTRIWHTLNCTTKVGGYWTFLGNLISLDEKQIEY